MQEMPRQNLAASISSNITRYTVQSSDVLSDLRINIRKEGSEAVLWYKERYLSDEEIIDHIVENATSTIQWSIHRPKRGWYIRLRAPGFPPGSFVDLVPLPQESPYRSEAALAFACRTNTSTMYFASDSSGSSMSLDSQVTLMDGQRGVHSYPPTPPQHPTMRLSPPSPQSIHARLAEVRMSRPISSVHITHFILTPHSTAHVPAAQPTFFARMMSVLRNSNPSHASSFTLSPIPPPGTPGSTGGVVPTPTPLLTYHDKTPVWTVNAIYGLIEIDEQRERELGVQTSFYVAAALTYLDFLTERESYIASEAE